MRFRPVSQAVALAAVAALTLAACSPGGSDSADAPGGGTGAGGGIFSVEPTDGGLADLGEVTTADGTNTTTAGPVEFTSYNNLTPQTYSTYNSAITDRLFAGFAYFGSDGKTYPNTDLGSYEKVSDSPLTIRYTINPEAKWSDGTDITVADAVLAWGTQNVHLADGDTPLFDSVTQDLGDTVPEGPQGDIDGKEFTVTFAEPDPDWVLQTWLALPAHVVAEQGGLSVAELAQAIRDGDSAKLKPAAQFWSTGWNTAPGVLPDEKLIPSSGPYKLQSWAPGESVTLVANENYYGTKAATKTLVFRFVSDDAVVQGLQNRDLDVISPQATVDTVTQLQNLGDSVQIQQGDTFTWEHLDFNFRAGNRLGESKELREAFAKCVPRQQIVDNLIKPINPEATVLNSREVLPFEESYGDVVSAAYDGRYDEVDIAGAKTQVEQVAGGEKVDVRIGYVSPNPRRANQVQLIKASCDQAGFNVIDAGDANFFSPGGAQDRGDYDAALFAWAGSGQITSGQNIYSTGRPQNYGQYSNPEVDKAWTTLATSLDPAVHTEQVKIIEKLLWDDLFGIPIVAHPGVVAASADIQNVRFTPTQGGVYWNSEQWLRAQ